MNSKISIQVETSDNPILPRLKNIVVEQIEQNEKKDIEINKNQSVFRKCVLQLMKNPNYQAKAGISKRESVMIECQKYIENGKMKPDQPITENILKTK